jgi:hypothetical protein
MRQEDVSWILHQALKQPLRIAKHQSERWRLKKIDYKRDGRARTKELIGFGEIEIVEVIRYEISQQGKWQREGMRVLEGHLGIGHHRKEVHSFGAPPPPFLPGFSLQIPLFLTVFLVETPQSLRFESQEWTFLSTKCESWKKVMLSH